MNTLDVIKKNIEKAEQEILKETFELYMFYAGFALSVVLMTFGIYFSAQAIALVVGNDGLLMYFNYSASGLISAIEIAMIKIFGNKERSKLINSESSYEHNIVWYGTFALFCFDFLTNIIGLYATAQQYGEITFAKVIVIVMLSVLMAFAEVWAGWMMRGIGTAKMSLLFAVETKKRFLEAFEKEMSKDSVSRTAYNAI